MAKRTYPESGDYRYAQIELTDGEFLLFLEDIRAIGAIDDAQLADRNGFIVIMKMEANLHLFAALEAGDSDYLGVCRESCLGRMQTFAMRHPYRK